MKKICVVLIVISFMLILILCNSVAIGQVKSDILEFKDCVKLSESLPLVSIDGNTVTIYQNFTILNLLSLYEKYEEECYNDSTKVLFGYFYNYETGKEFKIIYEPKDDLMMANFVRTEHGYIHREPTFNGFIVFLRQQLKKEQAEGEKER